MADISVDYVLGLDAPTKDFLCKKKDNIFNVEFVSFIVEDYYTKRRYFELDKEKLIAEALRTGKIPFPDRTVKYKFPSEVLESSAISTTLTFTVGSKPVEDFQMIERHYFRGELLKSFEFDFGFVIPNSKNTWETTYLVPGLSPAKVQEIAENPWEMESDSFYFAGGKLIMHNKAKYNYYIDKKTRSASYEGKYSESKQSSSSSSSEGKSADRVTGSRK